MVWSHCRIRRSPRRDGRARQLITSDTGTQVVVKCPVLEEFSLKLFDTEVSSSALQPSVWRALSDVMIVLFGNSALSISS